MIYEKREKDHHGHRCEKEWNNDYVDLKIRTEVCIGICGINCPSNSESGHYKWILGYDVKYFKLLLKHFHMIGIFVL